MSNLRAYFLAVIVTIGVVGQIQSQDSQFSQFYANPLYLNPALTGSHSGTFRLMSNYRSQWGSAIENPFTTLSAGGDLKFQINNGGNFSDGHDIAAVGIQFFSDRVASFDYNITQISLFGAYHKLLSNNSKSYLSAGFQLGLGQRSINYEDVTFGDQFNGVNQYTFPTMEILPANSLAYPDVSFGLHYSITPKKNKGVYLGVAYQHFNEPNTSFFDNDLRTGDEFDPFKQNAKITGHLSLAFPINRAATFQPRAIYIAQGPYTSSIVGGNLQYELVDSDEVSTHLGAWVRMTDNLTTFEPTDIIISAAYQKKGLQIGFSYDIHLRDLTGSQFGQGTFELSISYIGEHENTNQICPDF